MAASKLPNKRFTLSEVLDILDVGDGPDKACNIAVIPQNEKDAILSDCDSDGSDMDYEGEMGHLPTRMLNAYAELMWTDDDKNNTDYNLPLPQPTSPPLPPGTVENGEYRASMNHSGQSQEPTAKLQVIKNKDQDTNNNISADGLTLPTTPSPPPSTVEEPRSSSHQRNKSKEPLRSSSHQRSRSEEPPRPSSRQTGKVAENQRSSSCQKGQSKEPPRSSSRQKGQSKEPPRSSSRQKGQSKEPPRSSTSQIPEGPRAQPEVVKNKDRVFKRSKRPAAASIPEYVVYSPNAAECVKQSCPDPMEVFLLMYPPPLREITIEMSNLYSIQTKGKQLDVSMDELLAFYGILVASGYSTVPRRRMHWSLDSDVHNESISNAMRRNRFDEIMASLHFADNTKITEDPFFKVRPIFTELNKSYKVMPYPEWLSVDESMIRYYGRHGCKQFIKGKPIRFGYKIWSLASSSGYMHHMEPYGGRHTLLPETGLGQGPSVVLGLAEQSEVPQGCKFHHDNLFTSLSLLDEMTKRGYGSCGTLRENRLFDIPFKPKREFMHFPRGTSEVLTQGEKLLVRWKDNNVVTIATNMEKNYTETVVKRWNKERRAFDQVRQPQCIKQYNEHMGGVDLHDQQVSRYSITIRSKKWWWPIFAWSLNSALVNSFYFYRDVMGGTIDLLTFTRVVAQSLMQRFGTKPLSHGRRSLLASSVQHLARYDQESHWPINTGNRFLRCRLCDKRTTFACDKCNASLHIECFKKYHGK